MSFFTNLNSGKGIAFMENAEKADLKDIVTKLVHINDYGYIHGEDGDFAVIQIVETPGKFYFANSVITDMLKQVDEGGMKAKLPNQGIVFKLRTSKKGRQYMSFEFIGDEEVPF